MLKRFFSIPGTLCVVLVAAHAALAMMNKQLRAPSTIIAPPPDSRAVDAMALGDRQFLFRTMALNVQGAGDGGGIVTPFVRYNMDYVTGWLSTLGNLDPRSNHHFVLAVRYFSYHPDRAAIRKLVDFVVAEATVEPKTHWFWLTQAMQLADHRLGDVDYALTISRQLAAYEFADIPGWIWFYPAILLEKKGLFDEAIEVVESAKNAHGARLSEYELNWVAELSLRLKNSTG